MRRADFRGCDSCFVNEAESDREQTKGRPVVDPFMAAAESIDRQAFFQMRLLLAFPRPRMNGEGELMLAGRRVRNGRPRDLDVLCDHTGVHDACVDGQV